MRIFNDDDDDDDCVVVVCGTGGGCGSGCGDDEDGGCGDGFRHQKRRMKVVLAHKFQIIHRFYLLPGWDLVLLELDKTRQN
jgi:hypothetical protein